jgi:hypothetical protein
MNQWQVFVIFHKKLYDGHYSIDLSYDNDNYTFIKTNERFKAEYDKNNGYKVINEWNLGDIYDRRLQQATYMAPSAIYHIYKNGIYKPYSHVGFLEYDIPLSPGTTAKISKIVSANNRVYVPLRQHHTINLYHEQNHKIGGVNCIKQIFADYNKFFKSNHKLKPYLKAKKKVTGQQSFIVDVVTFEHVMSFISHVIENKLAERPKSWRRPSTLLDRYFAVALMLEDVLEKPIALKHLNFKQWKA